MLSELSRQMKSKWGEKILQKWAGKSLSAENVWEWYPKQHIKAPTPHTGSIFFVGVLTLWMNLKISFLWISRSICIFGKKVSSKSCSALNFLSLKPRRRVVPKYSILNEGRTGLTNNSVLTDYLKVGLRVNSNGPRMKSQLEFS